MGLRIAAGQSMHTGDRQKQWREKCIDGCYVASGHDGESTIRMARNRSNCRARGVSQLDRFRPLGNFDERAIEIQKERGCLGVRMPGQGHGTISTHWVAQGNPWRVVFARRLAVMEIQGRNTLQ